MAKDAGTRNPGSTSCVSGSPRRAGIPPDVAARFPKSNYDPNRDFSRYDPLRNLALSVYVSVQFLAIMAANSHFLALLAKQGTWWNVAYFVFILGSLLCLGGVLESRRDFLLLEGLRMACIAIVTLGPGVWFGGVSDRIVIRAIAGFALVSLAALWVATRRPVAAATQRAAA